MRHILHADFDAFYASVEQLDNPGLQGRPVVVGGSADNRGVVASASYEARKFGVKSAMPMKTALRLCPNAVRVGSNFDRYREVSRKVMAIFHDITPLVEPLSLDEAFLDVTAVVTLDNSSKDVARGLKDRVKDELELTISVGVATNKSIAKIASDIDKPDGLTVVAPEDERGFLAPLPVQKVWGIGPKTTERLNSDGIRTISDLTKLDEEWFRRRFGKNGVQIRNLALGRDERPVMVERDTKSVSAETTLTEDTGDDTMLTDLVNRLSERVSSQLSQNDLHGKTIKLKLRLSDFTTFTRQATLPAPAQAPEIIADAAVELLKPELRDGRKFRLVGVGVSGFDDPERFEGKPVEAFQPRLFGFE